MNHMIFVNKFSSDAALSLNQINNVYEYRLRSTEEYSQISDVNVQRLNLSHYVDFWWEEIQFVQFL